MEQLELGVQRRVVGGERLDQGHVGVRGEELGIGGVEHDDADLGVVGQGTAELVELEDELEVEEVDRRVVEGHPRDVLVDPHLQRGEVVVGHGFTPEGRWREG